MPSRSIFVPADLASFYRRLGWALVEERASIARLAPPAIRFSPRKFNKKMARQSPGRDGLATIKNEQKLYAPDNGTAQD